MSEHVYDFKHPARMSKAQIRVVENLHQNLARLLSSTFSHSMRAIVDVDIAFVDQTTYREFIESLSNPGAAYEFNLGPKGLYDGRVIMDFQMPIVFSMVDRAFGGKGSDQGAGPRQMSQIEMGVFAKLVIKAVEDVEAMWEPIVQCEIHDIELETNPEFMRIVPNNEIVLLFAFEVRSTNAKGLISLCYPYRTMQPLLSRLGHFVQDVQAPRRRESSDVLRHANRLRLGVMDLPIAATLGRTQISVGEAEQLAEGDVIMLSTRTTDPAVLHIGGKAKYLARPFAEESGELKLQVAAKIPPELQSKYGTVTE